MTDSDQPPSQRFEAEDELDYLFANASPNPNREGCPSRDELIRVSRREKPIGDAGLRAHRAVLAVLSGDEGAAAGARPSRRARMWAVAAAAVVALIVGGSWWMLRSPERRMPRSSRLRSICGRSP